MVSHQLASGPDSNQCGHVGKVYTREIYEVVSTSLLQLRCAGRHDKHDFFFSFPASSWLCCKQQNYQLCLVQAMSL